MPEPEEQKSPADATGALPAELPASVAQGAAEPAQGQPPEPREPQMVEPNPSPIDALVDRWFGDHAIPNFFLAAKEDLKRRLASL